MVCLQWSCQIDATETNKPEFNLKCLGHATVSGNMKTLAIFAINYDQFEHSFHLCFTGWTVAPKCLFPLRPGFVKIMPSWAFFFFFFPTVPWKFSKSKADKTRVASFFTAVLFPCLLLLFNYSKVLYRESTHTLKNWKCCHISRVLQGDVSAEWHPAFRFKPALCSLTRATQCHPLLPGNSSGAQAASASPHLHEIKHKTLIEAD